MAVIPVQIHDRRKKKWVNATLTDVLAQIHRSELDQWSVPPWWADLKFVPSSCKPRDEEGAWRRRIYKAEYHGSAEIWVIDCAAASNAGLHRTQACIVFYPSVSPVTGAGIVMVAMLESAPHNRSRGWCGLWKRGRYRGAGLRLLKQASVASANLGFGGVVGLIPILSQRASTAGRSL